MHCSVQLRLRAVSDVSPSFATYIADRQRQGANPARLQAIVANVNPGTVSGYPWLQVVAWASIITCLGCSVWIALNEIRPVRSVFACSTSVG